MITPIYRKDLVDKAVRYLGIPYTYRSSRIWENPLRGKLSCKGLVIQVAKDCGILPPDYPINIKENQEDLLHDILATDFEERRHGFPEKGDLILMRYADVDPRAPLHVAIKFNDGILGHGHIIHSINYDIGGDEAGRVCLDRLAIEDRARIISCHSYKGFID